MTRIAPKLQATLEEVVDVERVLDDRGGDGVMVFHVRYFFGRQSQCRDVAFSTIAARLRRLAELGLVERVPRTRPQEWRVTETGREQARR